MSDAEGTTQRSLAAMPIAEHPAGVLDLAVAATEKRVSRADVDLLKATICSKLTDGQLALFVRLCDYHGVSPFTGAYGFPNADGGLAFGLRIDGMRALARRKASYTRKVELLPAPDNKALVIGARCEIHRAGDVAPFVAEVLFSEYNKGGSWDRMPETMIKKVAEAHALRAAFPDALDGVYEPSEIRDEQDGA